MGPVDWQVKSLFGIIVAGLGVCLAMIGNPEAPKSGHAGHPRHGVSDRAFVVAHGAD